MKRNQFTIPVADLGNAQASPPRAPKPPKGSFLLSGKAIVIGTVILGGLYVSGQYQINQQQQQQEEQRQARVAAATPESAIAECVKLNKADGDTSFMLLNSNADPLGEGSYMVTIKYDRIEQRTGKVETLSDICNLQPYQDDWRVLPAPKTWP